jgi:thiol-disulfide isomerase/thioredoxin
VVIAAFIAVSCQPRDSLWFKGDLSSAAAAAKERDSLLMLEFYTDWCSWCRRLEKDTLSDGEVRKQLRKVVAVRVNAEEDGRELARRYDVDIYPTIVFTDHEGDEIDRIIGYLPPEQFLSQAARIEAGGTFVSCLRRLSEDPADQDAIVRAVVGLLERSDPDGAIARIKAFHEAAADHDHLLCMRLMFKARIALQTRLYARAAKLYRRGWEGEVKIPDTEGASALHAAVDRDFGSLDRLDQAELLHDARYQDAAELLGMVSLDRVSHGDLWEIGDFAFRNGHYDVAADAYARWYETRTEASDAVSLNGAAWQLYLSRRSPDVAVEMSRAAWALRPIANYADTLGRLLYVTGERDEAIEMQRFAADNEAGIRVQWFRDALELMEAGEELEDEPAFETYPDEPKPLSSMRRGTVI